MTKDKTEAQAIAEVDAALESLEPVEAVRVLRWAGDKYGGATPDAGKGNGQGGSGGGFSEISDLVTEASPSSQYERVLVATYWFQEVQGQADVTGQQVNSELNNLGHKVANITEAFTNLMNRKPALVVQTGKSGTSRQARKRYKLTTAGKNKVKRMLAGTDDDE